MKVTSLLALVLVVLLSSASWALVIGPSLEYSVWYADAVVIARPLELKKIKVSEHITYELGVFRLTRALAGGAGSIHFGKDRAKGVRFSFLRLYEEPGQDLRKFDFQIGKDYILSLKRIEPAICYTPVSNYHPFPEATEKNVKRIRKALFGREEERFAADGMTVEDAVKHADKVISGIEKEMRLLFRRGKKRPKPKERFDLLSSRIEPHHVFRHLANDNRTLAAYVLPNFFVYAPLANHDTERGLNWSSWGENKMIKATVSPSRFSLIEHSRHNYMNLGRALLGERTISIRGKKFEVSVYVKLDAGLVGDPALGRED